MSDLDEGRDVREALGGLLVGEPAGAWSAADDVARGRALQRRRRTRAGAGIGLVAAAVMVLGVFGPFRPKPAVVVPPAYQPPAVQGVDAAWLAALDRSFTAFNGPVVDWSRSTVTPTAGGGFTLDLTLVGATVTTGGEDFTIEYADPPGPPVARAFVTWRPAGGFGPVLASCTAPACSRADRGISPGFAEEGGRWDADGAQAAGTFVVDRTYDDGAMLELASAPHPDAVPGGWDASIDYGGIRYVLDRVGRPSDAAPSPTPTPSSGDPVAALLESYGFRVTDSGVLPAQGGGVSTVYNVDVDRAADNPRTAILSLTTYPAAGVPIGATSIDVPFTVLAGCTSTTCTPIEPINVPCPSDACFQYWTATTTASYDGVLEGTRALFRSDGGDGMEAVAGPVRCDTCQQQPVPEPFLTLEQTQQVLEAYQAPSAPAGTPCTAEMVKLVPAVDTTGGATGERSVAIEVYARNPQISCVLDGVPTVALQSGPDEGAVLVYTEGLYQQGPQRGTAVTVDAEHAAVFVVAKSRCDVAPVDVVDQAVVQLPGDASSIGVDLPPGFGLELCGGAAADTSTVWVSAFTLREGGVG